MSWSVLSLAAPLPVSVESEGVVGRDPLVTGEVVLVVADLLVDVAPLGLEPLVVAEALGHVPAHLLGSVDAAPLSDFEIPAKHNLGISQKLARSHPSK